MTQTPSPDPALARRHYRLGLLLAGSGGVCLSFGGLIVRNIETDDGFLILAVRSLAYAATLLVFLVLRYRGALFRPFRDIGLLGLINVPIMGFGFTCYLFGLMLTTVANAVFIVSLSPLFAAAIGWLALRERVPPATLLAIALALGGVGVMVSGGLAGEGLAGMLVALGAPIALSILVVSQRYRPAVDMVPAVLLGGLVAGAIALPFIETWTMSGRDLALTVVMGVGQVGAGFILLTLGARWLPPAQTTLLSLGESLLAPLWVWLFVAEVPSLPTLAGGAMILIAVAGQAAIGLRQAKG